MDMKLKIIFMQECSEKSFKLKFQEPKKDTIDKCKTFSNTPITGRTEKMKDEHMKHI